MTTKMTAEKLIAEAVQNSTGQEEFKFSVPLIAEGLQFALTTLLDDFDYAANLSSGSALAARILASLIARMEEMPDMKETLQ
jgi:hypothetical protein